MDDDDLAIAVYVCVVHPGDHNSANWFYWHTFSQWKGLPRSLRRSKGVRSWFAELRISWPDRLAHRPYTMIGTEAWLESGNGMTRVNIFLLAIIWPANVTACSFDRDAYEKVVANMSAHEVDVVLGCSGTFEGSDVSDGTRIEYFVWETGSAYVSVRFRDGLLFSKKQHGLR